MRDRGVSLTRLWICDKTNMAHMKPRKAIRKWYNQQARGDAGNRCISRIHPETPSYPMFSGGRKPERWEKQGWKACGVRQRRVSGTQRACSQGQGSSIAPLENTN
jgi:hypothetical protein